MKPKKETFIRLNSRVRKDQLDFIKVEAKKHNKTEGEVNRMIIDYYIKTKPNE